MSYPNQAELEGEWLNQVINIVVYREDGQFLNIKYKLEDGRVPERATEGIQEIVDELLDKSEL